MILVTLRIAGLRRLVLSQLRRDELHRGRRHGQVGVLGNSLYSAARVSNGRVRVFSKEPAYAHVR